MSWVSLDDGFSTHRKMIAAGPLAVAMQTAALCYCNRHLTDGFIPEGVAEDLVSWEFDGPEEDVAMTCTDLPPVPTKARPHFVVCCTCGMQGDDVTSEFVIGLLLDRGIWSKVDGGYQIHDYLDWNWSREKILSKRAASKAQRAGAGRESAKARKSRFGTAQPKR